MMSEKDSHQDEIRMLQARVALLEGVLVTYLLRTLTPESVTNLVQVLRADDVSFEFDLPARQRFMETISTLRREIQKLDT